MAKRVKNNKREFSKIMCVVASLVFVFVGFWMIWKYYSLVEMAIQTESSNVPDASLPITGITSILVPFISYLAYQAKLKDSRNKYGISENGVPYVHPDESEE